MVSVVFVGTVEESLPGALSSSSTAGRVFTREAGSAGEAAIELDSEGVAFEADLLAAILALAACLRKAFLVIAMIN